ncbi:hypothetical protein RhiirA4_482220, partial [Rhizophagus irregularis]
MKEINASIWNERSTNFKKWELANNITHKKKYVITLTLNATSERRLHILKNILFDKWEANYFANWTIGNEKIDKFIQEKQLRYETNNVLFEWIYNEFIGIKEKFIHRSFLKYLHNLQNVTDEFLNEVKTIAKKKYKLWDSQNPVTKNYIFVFKGIENNCLATATWKEGTLSYSEKKWIRNSCEKKKQLKLNNNPRDRILEWIPYDEFIDIKEIGQSGLATTVWKEGPLFYNENEGWIRLSYQKVILKFLYDSENITDEFINKVESYLADDYDVCYGISQNPDTKDYILIFSDDYLVHRCKKCGIRYYNWCQPCQVNYLTNNFTNWTSGNERIDNFIQEKQLKYDRDTVFEWIPYDKLIDINEIGECDLTTAIWKDGPLSYDTQYNKEWMRKSYEKICLRYLYNSQEVNDEFINKIESFLLTGYCYGISKIPGTTDYIFVFSNYYFGTQCKRCGSEYENYNYHCSDWCKLCRINQLKNDFTNWTSGNKIIDNFIQEIQLKDCKVFEWIPYDEFFDINELGKIGLTTAIWKNGPLSYDAQHNKKWDSTYEKVSLRYLHNSQDTINEFINKVKSYLTDSCYGISQNPDTKDYILVYPQNYIYKYCKECGNKYEDFYRCKPCIINYLKNNFINWTSGNEKIDNFIQETQLKSDKYNDTLFTLFEWIPYVGFTDINEIRKGKFAMAIWKDGPLSCPGKWERGAPEKVYLKYLHNSQDITETLSEIKCSMGHSYGISQDPSTKDFILVLQHMYYCKKCGEKYKNEFEINNKSCMSCQISHENEKISELIQEMKLSQTDIIFEWIPYDQFNNVEEIGKGGFST